MPALTTGQQAPDLLLPTITGETLSLSKALRRGPVVLAFFKVSCPVCHLAFPYLERLYQGYKGTNVSVIGVSQNSRQDTAAFIERFGITFPVGLDDRGRYEVSNSYGITNVPTTFYIARDGDIEVSSVGWVKAEISEINARLAAVARAGKAALFAPAEEVPEWRPG